MCVYIFLCVHTRAWVHVCTCVHMHEEAKGCWMSPLILLYLIFLRQGLFMALESNDSTRLSGHQVPGTPLLHLPSYRITCMCSYAQLLRGCWRASLGPNGCVGNAFLPEVSPQSKYS